MITTAAAKSEQPGVIRAESHICLNRQRAGESDSRSDMSQNAIHPVSEELSGSSDPLPHGGRAAGRPGNGSRRRPQVDLKALPPLESANGVGLWPSPSVTPSRGDVVGSRAATPESAKQTLPAFSRRSSTMLFDVSKAQGDDSIVTVDCGGKIFKTFLRTLRRIPKTRLCRMADKKGELANSKFLFLDRNPECFAAILEYHRLCAL